MNCCGNYPDRYGYVYPPSDIAASNYYANQHHQNHHAFSSYHHDYNYSFGPPMNNLYNYDFNHNYYNYPYEFSENSNYDAYRTLATRFPYYHPSAYREAHPYSPEKLSRDRVFPPHYYYTGPNVNNNQNINVNKDLLYSSQSSLNDETNSGVSSNYSNSPLPSLNHTEYPLSTTPSAPPFTSSPHTRIRQESYENSSKFINKNYARKNILKSGMENQNWMVHKPRNRKHLNNTEVSKTNTKVTEQHEINKEISDHCILSTPSLKRSRSKRQKSALLEETKAESTVQNIIPLPGFQQAFGSTEIGRFSEAFFHIPESPIDSDADNFSPQPWEGDSLEGPHFQPYYQFTNNITESSPLGSCFSELTCNDF